MRTGYCRSFIVPWTFRRVMSWARMSSVHIQFVASLLLSSRRRELVWRWRTVFTVVSILLGLSSAFTTVSRRRAISSGVKWGSNSGLVPVGWISICLSRTAARAMAGVVCVGV